MKTKHLKRLSAGIVRKSLFYFSFLVSSFYVMIL